MDVHIEEMHTAVRAVDAQALLTPAVLSQIVQAVLQELEHRAKGDQTRKSELDLRSVVERQRAKGMR
ncbi:hypothetical protein [Rhodococcus wratislaviensis]|uniref:Uncharacterized protein n=1 Tax=Rhodococcus wratislaviensis NBRC 100605 TaxID=1219028 RepID=X0RB53_RHOWR|nr:hypothetical protein [Rhodococcus wratislaviensis]GAF48250.1 hypothetical protein RW1_051_00140 [Rhodococcus wratislaviensis NBRC 100605]